MSALNKKTLGIVVLLLEQLMVCEGRSCSWSKNSAVNVDSCPESKDELEKRAKLKNCTSLAVIQNCTEPAKFKYHCLIDEAELTFIEVCVPLYNINLGFCAEYNTVGALVQQHIGLKCNDMEPPCPQHYKSTDAYMYKGCYEIVKRRQTTSSDIGFELSTKLTTKEIMNNSSLRNMDSVEHLNAGMVIVITFAVVVVLVFGIVTTFMAVRKKIHRRKRRLKNEKKYVMLKRERDKEHANLNESSYWTPDESTDIILEDDEEHKQTTSSPKQKEQIEILNSEPAGLPSKEPDTDTLPAETSDNSTEESDADDENSDTENRKKKEKGKECNIEEYKEEMEKANSLRDTVAVKDTEMAANFERKREDAYNFIQAYEDVIKCFVKTGLLKKCQSSLKKNGITILSGQQGSGKTLSAVYIMSKIRRYKQWTKIKLTSWVDLFTTKVEPKTLVYIDNLFDGYMYMYPEELRKWWHSLCYFYFVMIRSKRDIHLLITVKDDAMKEACEQIKTNIDENFFYLKADDFPLTDEERKQILYSQFKLAEKLKGIKCPEIVSTYADIKEKIKSCAIGFPLCAHLYALETERVYRTKSIFTDPVSYVIHHFEREIEKDKSASVKTLFLFLLFYTSPSSFKPSKRLDLRYGNDIRDYLRDTRVVPENLVKEMEPLNFEKLHTVAESLKYTILVKQSMMFEFKHQIYLDGASDYFLRKNPEVAVRNFPLTIIRSYDFPDASTSVWDNLINRFKRELQENINLQETKMDIKSCHNMIPEVLSCKIFDREQFEIKFREKMDACGALNCLLSNKKLRFPFWASRFGRNKLSQTAFNSIEEHSDYQLYQSYFGECCGKEKKYYFDSNADLDLKRLKEIVWNFKTADGKSILHLVLCSDRSDYEAHLVLVRLLKDISGQNALLINDLLNCAFEQLGSSRLLCMLELLRKQDELLTRQKPTDVSNVVASLKLSQDNDIHSELEFLVRICIVLANCEKPTTKTNTEYNSIDIRFRHVRNLLDGNVITQPKMTKHINNCLAECSTPSLPCPETKNIPFTNRMSDELKRAIYDSVQVLSRRSSLQKK